MLVTWLISRSPHNAAAILRRSLCANAVGDVLIGKGHEVLRLRDCLPTNAVDPDVIAKAQQLDAIFLSLNGDFADIVTYPPAAYKGIVSLQVRNHPEVLDLIVGRLIDHLAIHPAPSDYTGRLFVVEPHRIRVRH
jgi:hypothetical protein